MSVDSKPDLPLEPDLKLEIGALSEEIKVTADAKLIQTDDSQRSQVLSTVQIQQLPLNGVRSQTARKLREMRLAKIEGTEARPQQITDQS